MRCNVNVILALSKRREPCNTPHANKILHHEFVKCFGWVRHVNFSLAIPEVRLVCTVMRVP